MGKEGYKEVRIGPAQKYIPNKWKVHSLSDVAKFINGKGFSSNDWTEEGLPIVRIQNLNDEEAEYNRYSGEVKERYLLKNGDILLSWSASLGAYKWENGKAILNQHIFKVKPKENIDKEFLYQTLIRSVEKLVQKTHGSTMKHIRKKELDLTYFPYPPLPEQKKIAAILSTVDEAIEKTDKIIDETKQLKKGLMQQLLTKGIGHDEFKEVTVRAKSYLIPDKWEASCLVNCLDFKNGKAFYKVGYTDEGNKVIDLMNISRDGNFQELDDKQKYISEEDFEKYSDYQLDKNDLIIAMSDMSKKLWILGRTAIIPKDDEYILNQRVGKLSYNGNMDIRFANYATNSNYFLRQLRVVAKGTAQKYVNTGEIKNAIIFKPPLPEQKKIASILSSVDSKIQKEKEYKEGLEQLKKGLMQKLLTGKIRVKVEDKDEED